MTVIKIFNTRIEAELAKSLLAANGITSQISADDQGGMQPSLAFSGGVKLTVFEQDADKAIKIIEDSGELE